MKELEEPNKSERIEIVRRAKERQKTSGHCWEVLLTIETIDFLNEKSKKLWDESQRSQR